MTITRLYALWCDVCKSPGPDGETKAEVVTSARKFGWRVTPPTLLHPHTMRAVCSHCIAGGHK